MRGLGARAAACGVALVVAATTALAGVGGVAASPAEARPERAPVRYVALGDSAAAGPIIVPQQAGQPTPCFRSTRDFPTQVGQRLKARSVRDVTCSSATIDNLFTAQDDAPPQLRALGRRTTHVTLGPIGANDVGVVQAVVDCLVPGCKARQGRSVHRAITALRPELRRALAAVERRAPRAEVVVVGYGRYLPAGGCPLVQPLSASDADYVQGLVDHVDRVLARSARRAGARFADLRRTPGALRHTACAAPGERWLEGLVPASLDGAIPFHPTALGMDAFAGQVTRALRRR